MFHSETLARVIHADRVRDLERGAEAQRLLAPADVVAPTEPPQAVDAAESRATPPASRLASAPAAAPAPRRPAARDGSTGVAA